MKEGARDPRLTPARADLAAAHLKGEVAATHFSEGHLARLVVPSAALRREPHALAAMETQLLFGEDFIVYERKKGWAWGQATLDDYVGFVEESALTSAKVTLTHSPLHRVKVLRSFVYAAPDMKSSALMSLGFNARLTLLADELPFFTIDLGADRRGYVMGAHIAPFSERQDPIDVSQLFLGTPYLWGGRDGIGMDCSGLVQAALLAAGLNCPRDTDMQEKALGISVDENTVQRGDLIFWPGHVGIMRDRDMLIHANAHHMKVTCEALQNATDRILKSGASISSVRRI
jgi:hypothetical protein